MLSLKAGKEVSVVLYSNESIVEYTLLIVTEKSVIIAFS